jgi:hypothetical protein
MKTTKKKRYPKDNFDPLTATPGGGTIWRDYDNPGRPVVTHGNELPQDVRARREKKEKQGKREEQ